MAAHRVAWSIYSTEAHARSVHGFMRGRAAQARVLNAGLPTAEPGGGELHELVGVGWQIRERFFVTSEGAVSDSPITGSGSGFWWSVGYSIYEDLAWAADALAQCEALAQQAALLVTQADAGDAPRPPTANEGSIHICGHETGDPCVVSSSFSVAIPAAPSMTAWQAGTNYLAGGEERSHAGEEWRNRRANNTQQLAPGVTGSGWMRISNLPAPWYSLGNEGYPTPWQVTHNGRLWSNPSAGNFWEPGAALWVDQGPA